jgi:hypothetical protein
MHKKISAAFILMLFTLGVVAVPVQAHFTLGKYTGTYDWHTNDYDDPLGAQGAGQAHIPGLTGYVFPGAGPIQNPVPGWGSGAAVQGLQVAGWPGYQSLHPSGNPPGSPQMWLQGDANSYAPFGAILTSTIKAGTPFNKFFHNSHDTIFGPLDNEVDMLPIEHPVQGDLLFAVNYTLPRNGTLGAATWPAIPFNFDRFECWIPPGFTGIKKENIVASFTNDWGNIGSTSKTVIDAEILPNRWTRVRVNTDRGLTGLTTGRYVQFGNQSLGDVWAYIRVNKVTAPTILANTSLR